MYHALVERISRRGPSDVRHRFGGDHAITMRWFTLTSIDADEDFQAVERTLDVFAAHGRRRGHRRTDHQLTQAGRPAPARARRIGGPAARPRALVGEAVVVTEPAVVVDAGVR